MDALNILQVLLSLVMLAHTSYLDIKYREVNPLIWVFYSPLVIFGFLNFHYLNLFLFAYSYIITSIVILVFYYLSLLGGADLFLLIILNLANAHMNTLMGDSFLISEGIEPLIVLIYSLVPITIAGLINVLRNYRYTPQNFNLKNRLLLAFSGKQITVKKFLGSKFVFPLTEIDPEGKKQIRLSFSIDEDDSEWRKKFKELLDSGVLREEDKIWVAWGVPVIPFILLGYSVLLIIGFPPFL
ncbi:A24 family peptidase C-terminal domain-containing protein [Sulfuracidifex tepidarius]|uniref:Uncharacterized protein n=1 Tax=Sulfuracidifex tepidarius TaxID=1294262 RepID=A0A510E4F0_9CREN|nr:A24 family peptidase C-terminal domain-containing protein [Sulfuracidifex tepidarius]BBG24586.1 hypothetical protein IC006_1915 [Sulfuracidifex tepidarius]BBG27374.1 hypothetical protein IC007_1923 [Sulfuracidifex tepidarius]